MKFTVFVVSALSGLTLAHPTHGDSELGELVHTGLAARVNKNGHSAAAAHNHTEVVPNFRLKCVCPAPICDPRLNSKSLCECQAANLQACFLKTKGGCKMPKVKGCS